ncbi:MAG: PAS domain S-box protein, partial [Syntrophales bacterium]|nr:PAS domain S-box protein [Syntrophales bacterium]
DIKMPRMSGLEMLKKCREISNDFVSIIITGHGDHEKAIHALQLGVFNYLRKPISLEELVTSVGKGIELLHLRRGLAARGRELEIETALKEQYAQNLERMVEERTKEIKKLSEAVKATTESIVISDLEGKITDVNEATLIMYGTGNKEDLVGKSSFDLIAPEDQQKAVAGMEEALEKGYVKDREGHVITKDGSRIPVEMGVAIMKGVDGEPIGFVGVIADITERKRAEEELRESEEKHRVLIETTDTGYLILDAQGRVIDANKEYIRLTGYDTLEEILGRSVVEWTAPHDLERNAAELKKCVEQGYVRNLEIDYVNRSEQITPIEINATLVGSGDSVRILSLCRDISERKRAEEKLKDTLESLRKAVNTTIQVMVAAVETRDPYTAGHQIRSANLARAIATEMGLPQEKIDAIRIAGSIHDIGKLSIPAEILSKPTKLSEIEFSLIKEHARRGFEMLKDVESLWPLAEIVHQHHERMDGSGYPGNLKGDAILIEARILAVADVAEAMASHRPYRPGMGIDAALNEIEKNRGILYDSTAADACLRLFREKGFKLEGT